MSQTLICSLLSCGVLKSLVWVCHLCGDCCRGHLWWCTCGMAALSLRAKENCGKKMMKRRRRAIGNYAEWKSQLIMHIARKRKHRGQRTRCRHAGLLLLFNFFSSHAGLGFIHILFTSKELPVFSKLKKSYQSLLNELTLSLRGIYNFSVCREDQGQKERVTGSNSKNQLIPEERSGGQKMDVDARNFIDGLRDYDFPAGGQLEGSGGVLWWRWPKAHFLLVNCLVSGLFSRAWWLCSFCYFNYIIGLVFNLITLACAGIGYG